MPSYLTVRVPSPWAHIEASSECNYASIKCNFVCSRWAKLCYLGYNTQLDTTTSICRLFYSHDEGDIDGFIMMMEGLGILTMMRGFNDQPNIIILQPAIRSSIKSSIHLFHMLTIYYLTERGYGYTMTKYSNKSKSTFTTAQT